MSIDLKEKVKTLPATPGVYIMKGSEGNIIYVGKSKNLKSRVATYFQTPDPNDKKAMKLFHSIKDFDYILTGTELEALLLESQLIREHKPWCNRLLKNPEAYLYLKITIKEDYPDIFMTSEKNDKDSALYFGPYNKRSSLERALFVLRDIYKMPCTKHKRKLTACINYSLGRCKGICIGRISAIEHQQKIDEIICLLNGESTVLFDSLEKEMHIAATEFDYEKATNIRNQINALSIFKQQTNIASFSTSNPLLITEQLDSEHYRILLLKKTQILFQYNYCCSTETIETLLSKIKLALDDYYQTKDSSEDISRYEIDDLYILYSYLKRSKNNCKFVFIEKDNDSITDAYLASILTLFR